jgi:hypothetical protein
MRTGTAIFFSTFSFCCVCFSHFLIRLIMSFFATEVVFKVSFDSNDRKLIDLDGCLFRFIVNWVLVKMFV